ncbi:unnamed protein product, partial [Iphiclides podalirius]
MLYKFEGIFRLACEHVLRTMRRGRETLLTLLEAFVYDPLVEWGGGKKRRGTRHVRAARAMLAVRVRELEHSIDEITEQFMTILPEVQQAAEKCIEENNELKSVETKLHECHQQMALIKEIEAYGPNLHSHPLYAISQKYASYKQAKNAVEDSMKALIKILNDFDTQIETFAKTNEVLNGPQLMAWVQEFSGPNEDDDKSIFEHIKEFMTNAGQSSMISQCEQAEAELNQSMQQTNLLVRSCLELLSQYAAVSQYYPQSRTEYHRVAMFRKYLATALESKLPEVCRDVSGQVTALVNADSNVGDAQQIIAYNYRLQQVNAEANVVLNKCLERLQLEGGPDAVTLAEEAYREAKANISNWVRTEEGSAAALEGVVIGMLCNLNRRYLMLENGAQSAGDCLVDLTSREGEWFLDDMNTLSIQAVELLSLLPLQSASAEDAAMSVAVECVRNANLLLADLVQLNYNFSTIILPEALKKIHSEDPSVLFMISELNSVIMNSPVPLNDLLAQLEMHFRYLVMDMESPAGGAQVLASELRARYEALLSAAPDTEVQSAGRMLLMGFNGLFAAVELRARELADHLAAPIPPAWRKIDHINDAMHMSAAMQSPALRSVLEDIFVVRRVQTVGEALGACAQLAAAFRGVVPPVLYDDAQLCRPVRRFTAEYVSRCVLGVHSKALASVLCLLLRRARLDLNAEVEQKEIGASWSVSLESLCEKVARGEGGAGGEKGAGGERAERAEGLAGALQAACARLERAHIAQRRVQRARAAARAARLRAAAHAHLHAEVLKSGPEGSALGGIGGGAGGALARRGRELAAAAERLAAAASRAQPLVASAHQSNVVLTRAKGEVGRGRQPGAALGGARAGGRVGRARARAARLAAAGAALAAHARVAAAMAQPAPRARRTLRTALAHWEKACTLAQKYSLQVTPVEESLMEMLHPEGNIDAHWVQTVSLLVRELAGGLAAAAGSARARCAAGALALKAAASRLEAPSLARGRLERELRAPLAATDEEPARDVWARWRAAHELLARLLEPRHGRDAADAAAQLRTELPALRDALKQLPNTWTEQSGRKLTRQVAIAPPAKQTTTNTKQGGGSEQRNAMGAGVWKRVRLKLEGREGQRRTLSPHDQVEYIITEATSAENLCLMYEGWMAWV